MEIKEFFEPVLNFIKGFQKKEKEPASKQAAKDRLKLVLMQDRASVSPDFFELMKQEIIDVIKKYIEIDEESLEVELARGFESGLEGPALYANIPIKNVKPVAPKSEENAALSEEEADKLADEILENIEAVSAGASLENGVNTNEGVGETSTDTVQVTKESVTGLKSVFGPESEELLRRVLKEKPEEETADITVNEGTEGTAEIETVEEEVEQETEEEAEAEAEDKAEHEVADETADKTENKSEEGSEEKSEEKTEDKTGKTQEGEEAASGEEKEKAATAKRKTSSGSKSSAKKSTTAKTTKTTTRKKKSE